MHTSKIDRRGIYIEPTGTSKHEVLHRVVYDDTSSAGSAALLLEAVFEDTNCLIGIALNMSYIFDVRQQLYFGVNAEVIF